MRNRWDDEEAARFGDDPLGQRVYSSRLLGADPSLVLYGGGNTSVKTTMSDVLGEEHEVLAVKGSGWDLATIERDGFAPVRLDALRRLADLDELTDSAMVRAQRSAMLDPDAPNPSVEAIAHALIPHTFVDHTHADAIATLTHLDDASARIAEVYGDRVIVIPYVMPGFILAKAIRDAVDGVDWESLDGMILMHHGAFTFGDDARSSYERMIDVVARAEEHLGMEEVGDMVPGDEPSPSTDELHRLADARRAVSRARSGAVIAALDRSPEALAAAEAGPDAFTDAYPLTPDHVLRAKPWPMALDDRAPTECVEAYATAYVEYHARNEDGETRLDPAPRWAIWPGLGTLAFGRSVDEARAISDIARHNIAAVMVARRVSAWAALSERDVFDVEYWELEQAKLARQPAPAPLQGRVALVTGGAGGIGRACVHALRDAGAVVSSLDLTYDQELVTDPAVLTLEGNVTVAGSVRDAVEATVANFGGLDLVVSNAGSFPSSRSIEDMNDAIWDDTLALNLTAHRRVIQEATPYLRLGVDPSVVVVGSKNVPAPGPGVGAYSAAKAGLTQLSRVAALELGADGIRVNVVHPNAVFDTGIWTEEILEARAAHYGVDVETYKRQNVLGTEVTSEDVARLVIAMLGPTFAKTTGAQVPIDGGNERVI